MFRLLMLVMLLGCSSLQAQAGGVLVPAYFDPETDHPTSTPFRSKTLISAGVAQ